MDKRKKNTEEDEVLLMLKKIGAHEVTESEKKEHWYQRLMAELNSPEREKHGSLAATVKDPSEAYRAKRKRNSK